MENDPVITVLTTAEKTLIELSNESASKRDYDRATIILETAREIGALINRLEEIPSNNSAVNNLQIIKDILPASSIEKHKSGVKAVERKRRRSLYPMFYRNGDFLVKVGYSKHKGEYEHKSLSNVLFGLVEVLSKINDRSHLFTMEEILPKVVAILNTEIPSYQPYLCLKWIKSLDLVKQHGRKGYSVQAYREIIQKVRTCWEQLPTRKFSK
ncbi:MAG: hypothetical protein ABSG67_06615 [Thermoguttaceae bacterium]|jgi:hypothetical protein